MLEQVMVSDIEVGVKAENWEDAIRKSAEHLLETDKIEERYIDEMIQAVHRDPPDIVLEIMWLWRMPDRSAV